MGIIAFNKKCALWKNPKNKSYYILQPAPGNPFDTDEGISFLIGDLKHPIKNLKEAKIKFLMESI